MEGFGSTAESAPPPQTGQSSWSCCVCATWYVITAIYYVLFWYSHAAINCSVGWATPLFRDWRWGIGPPEEHGPQNDKSPAGAGLFAVGIVCRARLGRPGRVKRRSSDGRFGSHGVGATWTSFDGNEKRPGRSRAFLHQFPLEGGPSYQVRESWTMPWRLSSLSISA